MNIRIILLIILFIIYIIVKFFHIDWVLWLLLSAVITVMITDYYWLNGKLLGRSYKNVK